MVDLYIKDLEDSSGKSLCIKCGDFNFTVNRIMKKWSLKNYFFLHGSTGKFEYVFNGITYHIDTENEKLIITYLDSIESYDFIFNQVDDYQNISWNVTCGKYKDIGDKSGCHHVYYNEILIFEFGSSMLKKYFQGHSEVLSNFFKLYFFCGAITDKFEWIRDLPILLYVYRNSACMYMRYCGDAGPP